MEGSRIRAVHDHMPVVTRSLRLLIFLSFSLILDANQVIDASSSIGSGFVSSFGLL